MHFIVSWDLKAQGDRWAEIDNALLGGLDGYSWLRLLSAFYIIEIDFEADWQRIHEKLLSVAQRYPDEANFLMSPIYYADSDFFVYHMPDADFYRRG